MICEICKNEYIKSGYKNQCVKCYKKQYKIDNRQKIKERNKQWRIDNRQKIKQYRIDNREKIKEQIKQYRIDNGEKYKAYMKRYVIDNYNKTVISKWKQRGLIELEGVYTYQSLYEYYLSVDSCEVCETKFKNSFDKCLDHCHTSNIFRWVLCRRCNTNDKWMTYFT
tara:strand:- start:17 stop:517 length:501 start_codon:yes stop_codon:yes gene_type:complete